MGRQMVGQRKPALVVAIHAGDKPDASAPDDNGGDDGSDGSAPDVATCPNCACQFDPATNDVVKPGKPVQGGPPGKDDGGKGYGADLTDSPPPSPGPMGSAADAARGDSVMADLLSNLRGGFRR